MFYLTKKPIQEIKKNDRVMVLADFSGIPAGTKGTIRQNYETGVTVEWDKKKPEDGDVWDMRPGSDGFGSDELEYLAFETAVHPFIHEKEQK
jgi:hypothetical protein